jgi:hypothetical protein
MKAGQSSATLLDVDIQVGVPGSPGGAGGSGGRPAAPGIAAAVFPQP